MTSIRWSQPIDMTLFLGREMWAFPEIKYNIAHLSLCHEQSGLSAEFWRKTGRVTQKTSLSLFFQFFSQNLDFFLRTKEKSL